MLTVTALRNLKPKSKTYKVFDRDGMYVAVSPVGTISFRYDYRLNERRETLTLGRYGPAGMSLAMAARAAARRQALGRSGPLPGAGETADQTAADGRQDFRRDDGTLAGRCLHG